MNYKYIALLRGINVGGKNIIKMADLKSSFASLGFKDVTTYIQSGNVVFTTEIDDKIRLVNLIEEKLSVDFQYKSVVVVIDHIQLKDIVTGAPDGFGKADEDIRFDVIFIRPPVSADEIMAKMKLKETPDRLYAGQGVIYHFRTPAKSTQNYLIEKNITVRNWNTTLKLLELAEK